MNIVEVIARRNFSDSNGRLVSEVKFAVYGSDNPLKFDFSGVCNGLEIDSEKVTAMLNALMHTLHSEKDVCSSRVRQMMTDRMLITHQTFHVLDTDEESQLMGKIVECCNTL